jgi:hypothetical protein
MTAAPDLQVLMEKAMRVRTQDEADRCFTDICLFLQVRNPAMSPDDAAQCARDNLGYWIGHTSSLRATLEPLYQCEHPYLGTVAECGLPDAETALALGMRMQEARRISPEERERVRLAIIAELKAAHAARTRGEP